MKPNNPKLTTEQQHVIVPICLHSSHTFIDVHVNVLIMEVLCPSAEVYSHDTSTICDSRWEHGT